MNKRSEECPYTQLECPRKCDLRIAMVVPSEYHKGHGELMRRAVHEMSASFFLVAVSPVIRQKTAADLLSAKGFRIGLCHVRTLVRASSYPT
jgi:hypothetical protein